MIDKGYISKEFTVWCTSTLTPGGHKFTSPNCLNHHQEACDTATEMRRLARSKGWFPTMHYGWMCPNCVERYHASVPKIPGMKG